jgi:hypothetical protein
MSASTTDPISDLITYLLSLDADKLRRLASKPTTPAIPAGFFGFIQAPEPVAETFGTPLFTKLQPIA